MSINMSLVSVIIMLNVVGKEVYFHSNELHHRFIVLCPFYTFAHYDRVELRALGRATCFAGAP